VAGASFEIVIAPGAAERIVAGVAEQGVAAGVADQRVIARPAEERAAGDVGTQAVVSRTAADFLDVEALSCSPASPSSASVPMPPSTN
jgi:hypothetical protein